MKYQKIRGHNRRQKQIQKWIESDLKLNLKLLEEYKYWKADVYVHPWCDISIINSQIPEPKKETRNQILFGLEKIYDNWKLELEKLNKPYYLKLWVYEPRVSKSQVVCAIDQRTEFYEKLFVKIENKSSDFKNKLSPDFKWDSALDEDIYWESDLLSPIEMYIDEESFNYDRKIFSSLIKNNVRKENIKIDGKTDTMFFVPKGGIWIGEK